MEGECRQVQNMFICRFFLPATNKHTHTTTGDVALRSRGQGRNCAPWIWNLEAAGRLPLKEFCKWYHTPWQAISSCPPKVTTCLAPAPPGSLFRWSQTCWGVIEECTPGPRWAFTLLASPSSTHGAELHRVLAVSLIVLAQLSQLRPPWSALGRLGPTLPLSGFCLAFSKD